MSGRDPSQLSLFGGSAEPNVPDEGLVEPLIAERDRELAEALPRFVRFGTSSWSFPGWKGIVWKGAPTEALLARAGLEAYAQQPLLRAVSLDRSYYGPLRLEDLQSYAAQIARATAKATTFSPSGRNAASESVARRPFRVVSKVWDEITTAVYPRHPRYGARAGSANPHFFDAERFASEVLAPYVAAGSDTFDTFVFELTPMPSGALDERTLVTKVDQFLSHLPGSGRLRWAFELRNAELFGSRWLDMLRANRAAHVLTFWTAMPPLRDQLRARAITAPFTVIRLMLPPYTRYAARKADFSPFDRLSSPEPEMREDVVSILRAAEEADVDDAFVLVNNKAEGSAPLTIRAIAEQLSRALRPA